MAKDKPKEDVVRLEVDKCPRQHAEEALAHFIQAASILEKLSLGAEDVENTTTNFEFEDSKPSVESLETKPSTSVTPTESGRSRIPSIPHIVDILIPPKTKDNAA